MSTKSTDTGEIDIESLRPPARRDAAGIRERAEASAFTKTDGRKRRRKGRTELISVRVYPRIREAIERMAIAEERSFVEVIEDAIELRERILKGAEPARGEMQKG
jgi:hypothetical protein